MAAEGMVVRLHRPVPDEQVERWRADRLASLPEDVPPSMRTAIRNTPHNETFPAFSGVLLDGEARIWIGGTPDVGAANRRWTVLARDGTPSFRVTLPASATLVDAAGDRLAILERTALAEEIVRVLSLGGPASTPATRRAGPPHMSLGVRGTPA